MPRLSARPAHFVRMIEAILIHTIKWSLQNCGFLNANSQKRSGTADRSLFKASDELCFNRTVHPSIHLSHHLRCCCRNRRCAHARMHDDRLCEERKSKRCFRADRTVILRLSVAINSTPTVTMLIRILKSREGLGGGNEIQYRNQLITPDRAAKPHVMNQSISH